MAIQTLFARLRGLYLLAVSLGIGAVGLTGQPSSAQTLVQGAPPASEGQSRYRPVSSPELSTVHRKVWTREEMLNARPYPLESVPGMPLAGVRPPSADGPTVIVPPQPPRGSEGEAWSLPLNQGWVLDPSYYIYYPYTTMGKVFFTSNGFSYTCSASVAGNHTVWTAGHCVFNPQSYTWHSDWVFVPGYYDGYAPNGYWYARELWTTTAWTDSYYNNYAYDFAMAVLWPDASGYSVTTRFGSLGSMFNFSRSQYYYAFGYAAGYPYNGERIAWCEGSPYVYDYAYNPPTNGIGCDLTPGSSGGPWMVYYSSGYYTNGVNSYKYTNDPYSMYSPYFEDAALNLYYTAISR
jgi:V8-like Glu-specific endopeptidase